ncbi:MAG: monovalent cation/H(+) antiporter subunit G [Planctomycetota bacterium]
MNWVLDILALISLAFGLFFMMVGALGLVRLPDVYHRIHAASKATTLGLLGLLLAAVLHVGTFGVATKALLTIVFAFVATPIGSHILAKAAHRDGAEQWSGTLADDLADDEK